MNIINELKAFAPLAKLVISSREELSHIVVKDGVMATTDGDHWIEMPTDYKGAFTIDSAMLPTLSEAGSVEVSQGIHNQKMVIDGQNVSCRSMSADNFPERPRDEFKELGEWDKDLVAYMVRMESFVIDDKSRPLMRGMFFKQNDMRIELCATDGHKLRRVRNVPTKSHVVANFIILAKAIGIVAECMDETVEVAFNDHYLRFKLSNEITLFHRFINKRFPNYASVFLPDNTGDSYRVNRKDMLKTLKIMDSFANKTTHQITVNLEREGTVVKVSSEDIETDVSWKTELPMLDYKGEGLEIGYNLRYFEDILKTIDSDMVTITNTTAASPSIITGDDERVDHLLTPIRLND